MGAESVDRDAVDASSIRVVAGDSDGDANHKPGAVLTVGIGAVVDVCAVVVDSVVGAGIADGNAADGNFRMLDGTSGCGNRTASHSLVCRTLLPDTPASNS